MSARISKMYKDSGGCKPGKTCEECRYFLPSVEKPKERICKKHGEENSYWKASYMACKFFKNPIKKKQAKLAEETGGQMKLILD